MLNIRWSFVIFCLTLPTALPNLCCANQRSAAVSAPPTAPAPSAPPVASRADSPDAGRKLSTNAPDNPMDDSRVRGVIRQLHTRLILAFGGWLAEKANDREAREVIDYLSANLYSVINIGSDIYTSENTDREHPVALFIFEGNMLTETPGLDQFLSDKSAASAWVLDTRPVPMIVFGTDGKSRFMIALMILHEGMHIMRMNSRPAGSPYDTEADVTRDEVRVYEFEMRLFDKLGGKRYAAMVNKQVTLLKKNPKSLDKLKTQLPQDELQKMYGEQNTELASIFDSRGANVAQMLWITFYLETRFRFIDSRVPNKEAAAELKANVYDNLVHILNKE
ncbi:MAG: hypothetical protein AAB467_05220 [Patescibacteria group bacterium]